MRNLYLKGQSLFEVMFAIVISALILLAVVSLSTQSVKNSDFSKSNAIASKYAQEGVEWIRIQRDVDWANITGNAGTNRNLGSLDWAASGTQIGTSIFNRSVDIVSGGTDIFNVTVKVTWFDGSGQHEVKNTARLTNWRK